MTEYLTQNEMWVRATRLREAEARITEIEAMLRDNPTQAEMDAAQFEINQLTGRLEAAWLCAEALATAEWFDDGEDEWFCPWCGNYRRNGHEVGCKRQAALATAIEVGLLDSSSVQSVESVSHELTAARRVVEAAEAHLSDSGPWSQLSESVVAYRAAYPHERGNDG